MELTEASAEPFPDEKTHSDTNTPEPLVKEKTDTEASDFDDTSATSDMSRAESHVLRFGSRGQGTNQATPSKRIVKSASEGWHTTASGAKTVSSAAGSKAKHVTAKDKTSTESTKVGTSSGAPPQKDHRIDEKVSVTPTLRDQSTGAPVSATVQKSKIPKRSTSDADMKSPVTPDKTSVTDPSGSALPSKLQKLPRSKESLKSPASAATAGRKPGFEEVKGGKSPSGDISPTKTTHKTAAKHIREKSDEDKESISLVNGLERDHEEDSFKTGRQMDRETK